jgi:hypothetical protein
MRIAIYTIALNEEQQLVLASSDLEFKVARI